jgi:hypothetical protein
MNIFKEVWFWIIAFSIVISGGILFYGGGINIFSEMEPAIIVNEEKINKKEFAIILNQAEENYSQMVSGGDFSKEEVKEMAIDMAIDQLLFVSYAKKLKISITKEEINDFYEEIILNDPEIKTKEELFLAWEKEGFDKNEMERQVKIYLLYDKIYEKYLSEAEVTEKDLEDAYNDYVAWMKEIGDLEDEGVMSFEDIKGELKEFIIQEKAIDKMEEEIENFREESVIEILV